MAVTTERPKPTVRHNVSLLTEHDIYLFKEGRHTRLYERLGAHPLRKGRTQGVQFAVWAPNAERVSVIGEFNGWNPTSHPLQARDDESGIWEGFIAGIAPGTPYKYRIKSRLGGEAFDKGDPFAFYWEEPPQTASRVCTLDYDWADAGWLETRAQTNSLQAPMAIYEVHLGSWRR